jgi:hypothetical protein
MTLCVGTKEKKQHGVVNGVSDALQWRAWPHAAQLVAGDWGARDEDGRGGIVEDGAWPGECVWVGGWCIAVRQCLAVFTLLLLQSVPP